MRSGARGTFRLARRRGQFAIVGLLLLVTTGSSQAADFMLVNTWGFTRVSEETVRLGPAATERRVLDSGLTFGGRAYVGVHDRVHIGVAGYVSDHDDGLGLRVEIGGFYHVLSRQHYPVCPYVAASAGFGHASWETGSGFFGPTRDGITFRYLVPEAGLEVVFENLGLQLGGRWLVTSFSDQTDDGLSFEADSDFMEGYAAVAVNF